MAIKQTFSAIALSMLLAGCTSSTTPSGKEPGDAKAYGKMLMSNLSGIFSLDEENKEKLGSFQVPPIKNGNWVIASRPMALTESFAKENNTVTTIFVRVGDDYVRISTTEKGQKPGDPLDHSSPAYKRMLGELRYTGKVTLSGVDYMADYDVFRDRDGRVIGAYLVGIPINE
jgi:methyl-accepting chemotaxis protein